MSDTVATNMLFSFYALMLFLMGAACLVVQ